jgi:PKD repeat protein
MSMSNTAPAVPAAAPAPATPAAAPARKSFAKMVLGGGLGLVTGAVAMYSQAAFDRLVKPAKPLANFQATADGLTVRCENRATGQSGFWDFGDGSALEPYDPAQETVAHTYAKPGNYNVKLIVRNFLMDEADRSVSVEVANPPATAMATLVNDAPRILDLKVEAIRDQVPATYRITGKLENADEVVWRLGDKTEHAVAPPGAIDRYVTFDKDGQFPIVLTALSKSRKDPQVVVQAVDVKKIQNDTYEALVSVTDVVTRSETRQTLVNVPAPVRDTAGITRGISRTLTAPGGLIIKAVPDQKLPAAVKNVKIEIAKDQKSAILSGEWALSGDALMKAAGGSDVIIPVVVTEERRSTYSPATQRISGVMDAQQQIVMTLPPRVIGGASTRTVTVDFGISYKDGRRNRVAVGTLDAAGRWASPPIAIGTGQFVVTVVTSPDQKLRISVAPVANPVSVRK